MSIIIVSPRHINKTLVDFAISFRLSPVSVIVVILIQSAVQFLPSKCSRKCLTGTLHMLLYVSDMESRQQFQKWHNGGGIFHQSACIDSTVLIEVGAIVHSKAVLGANVCIGSGTVVGPAVTIGQSTNIGYFS